MMIMQDYKEVFERIKKFLLSHNDSSYPYIIMREDLEIIEKALELAYRKTETLDMIKEIREDLSSL